MQFLAPQAMRKFQSIEYSNPTMGNQIELLFRSLVFGYWIYAVGFSRKARLYYDEKYFINLEQEKIRREQAEGMSR